MEKYIPDIYQKSVYTIDYQKLIDKGIKCLLFDLDNTLISSKVKKPNKKVIDLINELKEKGFNIIIFSNAHYSRVKDFAVSLDLKYYSFACKPLSITFNRVLEDYKYTVCEVAIIGDQLLTDIIGGNKVGITTILINPISKKDGLFTKINRVFERHIMKKLRNANLFVQGKYYD